ncbi:Uu.00g035430.m01.CDS01 [Anthostomella pinea]|uniref:Uu.00g035430.m01.CDS01 n=1 Tax=Anthostomella pinea TaxID=933095 RepID=A0AAI8V985_9PEZI|nr:Uu.00g035430.m01.CDS01 [Anthostomella pinea]
MSEVDPLVLSYSHLADFPRANDALHSLKKIASLVKPLMRARGWKVKQLTEFYPGQQNLLGLNVGAGQKICLRLRYPGDRDQFLPIEQVTDTMLHELAHNVHGPHDAKFHALWNQLRDEHEGLAMKGYTGEGFLSEGRRLGGKGLPIDEARRVARAAAEKRRTLNAGSGQRLGGAAPRPGQDVRRVIANAVERRSRTLQGCANDNQTQDEIREIADTATRNGFRTQAEEDAANEAATAQALWELVQEDEKAKHGDAYVPPSEEIPTEATDDVDSKEEIPEKQPPSSPLDRGIERGKANPTTWTCEICTLQNPAGFLCCDACGTERSEKLTNALVERPSKRQRTTVDLTKAESTARPATSSAGTGSSFPATAATSLAPQTWRCHFCGRVREKQWWSCDLCGSIKTDSK